MRFSPSVFAADPLRIAEQVVAVAPYVESLHIDVMDGRFAPRFGLNEDMVRSLAKACELPLDLHLMVEDTFGAISRFALPGVRTIVFHAEGADDRRRAASAIRAQGILAYIGLRPEDPVTDVEALAGDVDGVLILSAPAGGGAFDEAAFAKIDAVPPGLGSIVDGKLEPSRFPRLSEAGVDLAVVGRALFDTPDPTTLLRNWTA